MAVAQTLSPAGNGYDITIVGAGIAGAALACALSTPHKSTPDKSMPDKSASGSQQAPPRIALIEAQPLKSGWPPVENGINDFDPRVSALTVASQTLLETIGVWPMIASQRVSPFKTMQVWDAEGTGEIGFDAADVRADVLGHIVENRVTVAALLNRLKQHDNVQVFDGQAVADLLLPKQTSTADRQAVTQVTLADGTVIESTLLVAADGANSPLRAMANLTTREWDYQHHAVVCTARVERPHQQTAWQRFTNEGPLAFLPLSVTSGLSVNHDDASPNHHYCSIVWSQTDNCAAEVMTLDDEAFCEALGRAFEHRLGKVIACSKRYSFPLRQRHAIDYVKPGFALVADAAHSIHPLAGQGINLGLADVEVLARCIAKARARGQSVGDIAMLGRYQRERKGDNLAMMTAVEGFKRIFEPLPLPLRWLRNAGMNAIDQRGRIKNRIIKHAMGIA